MSLGTETLIQHQAEHLQEQADRWTNFRHHAAYVIGVAAATTGESWPLAGLTTTAAYSDMRDGQLAREAAELAGRPTTDKGAEDDHRTDKEMTYGTLAGLAINDLRQKRYVSGLTLLGIGAAMAMRDYKMAQVRDQGREADIDVKAIGINKAKTVIIDAGLILGTSPISRVRGGRIARNLTLGAGAAMGVVGYSMFKRDIEKKIVAKTVPADTIQAPAQAVHQFLSPRAIPSGRPHVGRRS